MSNRKFWLLLSPLLVFIVIGYFLWIGLSNNPRYIPSPLQNKPAPDFRAVDLLHSGQEVSTADFKGKITILNVFATWCSACQLEHSVWIEARHDSPTTQMIGLDLKDDKEKVLQWLKRYGNPYDKVIFDLRGDIAIDFGVYGTPETFIIDRNGVIRYKFVGEVDQQQWEGTLLPAIKKLESQP